MNCKLGLQAPVDAMLSLLRERAAFRDTALRQVDHLGSFGDMIYPTT